MKIEQAMGGSQLIVSVDLLADEFSDTQELLYSGIHSFQGLSYKRTHSSLNSIVDIHMSLNPIL